MFVEGHIETNKLHRKLSLQMCGLDTGCEEHSALLDHRGLYEFGILCGAMTKAYS